jgi:hypothetical protein
LHCRWQTIEAKYDRDVARAIDLKSSAFSTRNMNSVPYNPLTLKYTPGPEADRQMREVIDFTPFGYDSTLCELESTPWVLESIHFDYESAPFGYESTLCEPESTPRVLESTPWVLEPTPFGYESKG